MFVCVCVCACACVHVCGMHTKAYIQVCGVARYAWDQVHECIVHTDKICAKS